jgi:hypothetical protein
LEVRCQLHVPTALLPEKELPVSIGYEAGWGPRTGLKDVERITILPLPGFKLQPPDIQSLANDHTECDIQAPRRERRKIEERKSKNRCLDSK